jgi:drug/metabolite transporter (DMT)-like permease
VTPSARSAYIGIACMILASIGFSAKTVVVKIIYQHGVDAMTLLTLRMIFSLPFFVIMAWWASRGATTMNRQDWLAMLGLGFLGYYVGSYLDFAGLEYISAGLGRLILYLHPTIVLLLSAMWLHQAIRARQVVSLVLSYIGIALVFWHEITIGENLHHMALGSFLVFCGAFTYSIYLIAGSRLVHRVGSMRLASYASIMATFFVAGHFAATHEAENLAVTPTVYGLTLIMAVFSTVLPLWLQAEGLKRIGASQATLVGCVGPLSTILLAHWFIDEVITAIQLVGATLVLSGVIFISLKPRSTVAGGALQDQAPPAR